MNRRTALTAVAISAIALLNGCKSLSAHKDENEHEHPSETGMFSKMRDNDAGNGSMGLSSKSREIERNLGVGE